MKVKLLKPFWSRKEGSIMTMHPLNAARLYAEGICDAVTDEEREYLEDKSAKILARGRRVEREAGSPATERAVDIPIQLEKVKPGRASGGRKRPKASRRGRKDAEGQPRETNET
jgi:hypothetical protein